MYRNYVSQILQASVQPVRFVSTADTLITPLQIRGMVHETLENAIDSASLTCGWTCQTMHIRNTLQYDWPSQLKFKQVTIGDVQYMTFRVDVKSIPLTLKDTYSALKDWIFNTQAWENECRTSSDTGDVRLEEASSL